MKDGEDEKHVRELNEAAERDAELSRIKVGLWQRLVAAMKEIPRVATKEPSHFAASNPASSSPKADGSSMAL